MTYVRRLLPALFFFALVLGTTPLNSQGKSNDKTPPFSGLTLPPASGKKPDSIVVLLHGYGDFGENFLFLGALLGQLLPNTLFVAPDGPFPCKNISSGRQWLKASSKDRPALLKELKTLTPAMNRYLDTLLNQYDIPPEKLAFLGFSQGARIALHVGLRRPQCAGIVAMSGSYLDDPSAKTLSPHPILILHGENDQKAPVSFADESYKRLEKLHMPVTLILLPGVEHDVAPQGLMIAGEFLKECFSGEIFKNEGGVE